MYSTSIDVTRVSKNCFRLLIRLRPHTSLPSFVPGPAALMGRMQRFGWLETTTISGGLSSQNCIATQTWVFAARMYWAAHCKKKKNLPFSISNSPSRAPLCHLHTYLQGLPVTRHRACCHSVHTEPACMPPAPAGLPPHQQLIVPEAPARLVNVLAGYGYKASACRGRVIYIYIECK